MGTLLDDAVARFGDRPAFDFLGQQTSYSQLGALVARAAKGLQARGAGPGTHIALLLPNCLYYPIFYFAALKIGATVVNCNPLYTPRELNNQIQDSQASILVTLDLAALWDKAVTLADAGLIRHTIICPFAKQLPLGKNVLFNLAKRKELAPAAKNHPKSIAFDRLTDNDGDYNPVNIDAATHLAVLQYTGGTTGVPKGAMLTHGNLYANVRQCELWFGDFEYGQERMMAVIPFFHIFAMTGALNLAIRVGAEIIALPRFQIDDLIKAIQRKKPTILPAVPTIYTAINNYTGIDKVEMHSIKACISGGAPLPREVYEQFVAKTGAVLVEGYGLSETAPVASVNPTDGNHRIGSIGLPLPQTEIAIVSLEDGKTRMPAGEKGEICIRGPQVMARYWQRPEASAEVIDADGFLHTGDVGIMEEDGFTYIVDRIKDLIIAGGFNVYPRHVEEAIYLHPAVEECVVGGVPDAYRGETVKAWIKLRDGERLTIDEMKAFLADKLSPIEQPKAIEFRAEPLPKTLIGKLSRKTLVDEAKAQVG